VVDVGVVPAGLAVGACKYNLTNNGKYDCTTVYCPSFHDLAFLGNTTNNNMPCDVDIEHNAILFTLAEETEESGVKYSQAIYWADTGIEVQ
jgi:hypothetical protein